MKGWYQNLATRERKLVSLAALFILFAIVYLFIYEPLVNGIEQGQTSLARKQDELSKLLSITTEYNQLGPAKRKSSRKGNQSLLALIDQTSTVVGIKSSIKRITPEGERKVRVRVEDVAFDQLIEWLVTNSSKHSMHAGLFLVRQTDKIGRVNATLLFTMN